jgi:plasmid maintenance system antidote protein VapI
MNGKELIDALTKQLGGISQAELARTLGKKQAQISALKNKEVSALTVSRFVRTLNSQVVRGNDLVPVIQAKLGAATNRATAELLGMTSTGLMNWTNKRRGITAQQIANAIKSARKSATRSAHAKIYSPIIELFPITKSQKKKSFEVFSDGGGNKQRSGLKKELAESFGLYMFFDSRGHALYVGKAIKQSIWKEMNLAFNRNRKSQTFALVNHPNRNVKYSPAHEHLRQPKPIAKKLHELAAYFSAYKVEPTVIGDFEALFIRAFPNDLLNDRKEKPNRAKKAGAKKKS